MRSDLSKGISVNGLRQLDEDVRRVLSTTQKFFLTPYNTKDDDTFAFIMSEAIKAINSLKPESKNSCAFLSENGNLTVSRQSADKVVLKFKGETLEQVLADIISTFEGLPNWGHPMNMSNICPQQNYAAIAASMLTQIFSPNILESEYAWNTAKAELESSAILADMAGWKAEDAGGIYTYGGSGCWMYQMKYALSRVLKDSRKKGIRADAKIICSEQAHYAMLNSSDWTGLGIDNIILIRTLPDSNVMDTEHLEEVLKKCANDHVPVVSIICTMATTDACAFDPVRKVKELMEKYPNSSEYGKSLLYCDAVIGWSWLCFKNYDFKSNPLELSLHVLESVRRNYNAIRELKYADAFGVDFHKNFSPLTSSIFMYRNRQEFEDLLKRDSSAYLQERGDYNPHNYSLEVSRSASGSMAGWATLKFFGAEGLQKVLTHGLQNKEFMLQEMKQFTDMTCVNLNDDGSVLLLRIYPENINATNQYSQELHNAGAKDDLIRHNILIEKIAELMWEWFRGKMLINGKFTPYLSITKGFRPTVYNKDNNDREAMVYAIKVYPVSTFIKMEDMTHVIKCIRFARDTVVN